MIKSISLYHIATTSVAQELDVGELVSLNMTPAPILWEYYGSYYLVPMEHVAEIMDAIQLHNQSTKKAAWRRPMISMNDAIPLDYTIGRMLSRRAYNEKLNARKQNRNEGSE